MSLLSLKTEAFGLDISDLSLKLAKLKKTKKGFVLESFFKKDIEAGIIENGEIKNQEALIKVIEESISEAKGGFLKTRHVVASLPEERAFLQVIQLPIMKEEEVEGAAKFEAENYIPFPIDQVYLSSSVVKPVHNSLDHLDVLIAALPKGIIDSYVFCLKKAGLVPQVLEIESQAIARALVKDQTTVSPMLLLDIGATRTSFVVFSGHSIRFTSSIPITSREFTRALAKNLKVGPEEAEELKVKYGLLGPEKVELRGKKESGFEKAIGREEKFFEALVPILTDFTEQIERRIDFYQSHTSHEHLPPNGQSVSQVILCGGGANLRGLDKFLSSELKIPTAIGNPWVNILTEGKEEVKQMSLEESLGFTTALGLALRGAS